MSFTLYERQYFGIHGLLPPAFMTEDQQAYRVITNLRQQPNDLARYVQLNSLQVLKGKFKKKKAKKETKSMTALVPSIKNFRKFHFFQIIFEKFCFFH